MTKRRNGGDVTTVFILLLCILFIFSILAVLLLGVDVYKGVTETGSESYNDRSTLSYIAAKVRHTDKEGAVNIVEYNGSSALQLTEFFGGEEYITMIYLYDGNICELFFMKSLALGPESGTPIISAVSLEISYASDDLIEIACDTGSGVRSFFINPRSETN